MNFIQRQPTQENFGRKLSTVSSCGPPGHGNQGVMLHLQRAAANILKVRQEARVAAMHHDVRAFGGRANFSAVIGSGICR
jgi:hypothetical protein